MNNVIISGNLVRDVDLRTAPSGMSIARMTVAVQRKFKDKQTGKYESDFINCLAFDKRAETLSKFVKKGQEVALEGNWRTGSYEKDGVKVYTNEMFISNLLYLCTITNDLPKVKKEMEETSKLLIELKERKD